jgi:hypothetical protein
MSIIPNAQMLRQLQINSYNAYYIIQQIFDNFCKKSFLFISGMFSIASNNKRYNFI